MNMRIMRPNLEVAEESGEVEVGEGAEEEDSGATEGEGTNCGHERDFGTKLLQFMAG